MTYDEGWDVSYYDGTAEVSELLAALLLEDRAIVSKSWVPARLESIFQYRLKANPEDLDFMRAMDALSAWIRIPVSPASPKELLRRPLRAVDQSRWAALCRELSEGQPGLLH